MWDECNRVVVWAFLALPFFGILKTDLFQPCSHCWVFQICWHIEYSPFTASSFRIWNSSSGIPSPPLALFIVMLPKAHLTSHSKMSGSRLVITPLWLSGSWRSVLYSSVYSCYLFLRSSASVKSIQFLSFIVPIFAWNVPLVSLMLRTQARQDKGIRTSPAEAPNWYPRQDPAVPKGGLPSAPWHS